MRKLVRRIYIVLSKGFMSLFYDRKYLKGRWFSGDEISGWKHAWRFAWDQKVKGYNRHAPFPVHPATNIGSVRNLEFDLDNMDNFWKPGSYFQSWGGEIHIGKNTWIAQNVGIITENHDLSDLNKHMPSKNVVIEDNCWIGMNCVILPGVHLGEQTVVGAGSIVTKSFQEGHCVIAGNPAKIIKKL